MGLEERGFRNKNLEGVFRKTTRPALCFFSLRLARQVDARQRQSAARGLEPETLRARAQRRSHYGGVGVVLGR